MLAVTTASSLILLKALLNVSNRYCVVFQRAGDSYILARMADDLGLVGELVDFAVSPYEDRGRATLDALHRACGVIFHAGDG
jgi:hypothetical protein